MSDRDSGMDIEAQRPLLLKTNTSPRRVLSQLILLYHSSAIFLSGSTEISEDEGSAVLPRQLPPLIIRMPPLISPSVVWISLSLDSIRDFGGVKGMADALGSDLENGLCCEHNTCQQSMNKFESQNQVPAELRFIPFLVAACTNCITILLSLAALLSLAFGMIQDGPRFGWISGVHQIICIIVIVAISSSHRYYLEVRSRKKYSAKQGFLKHQREMKIHVIREGHEQQIDIYDLVYGDIVSLERGYQVPADGLFIDRCNKSSLEVMDDGLRSVVHEQNPFLFYGSKVIHGSGRMIATSVGRNTAWSELMSQTSSTADQTKPKLEAQFDKFTNCTNIISLLITILIFIASFLRFAIRRLHDGNGHKADSKGESTALRMIVNTMEKIITEPRGTARTLITLLSISLVGIMDGMSFVVSIAITMWNNNTLTDHKATGRDLLACLKMASITSICTDKIGVLIEHRAEVVKFVGDELVNESIMLSQQVLEALSEGFNSKSVPKSHDSCSSLEESLLSSANDIFGLRSTNLEQSWSILQGTEQDHSENLSRILLERNGDDGKEMRLHCNETVNQILPKCSHYYNRKGQLKKLDSQKKQAFKHANENMVANKLTPIAFACKTTREQKLEATNDLILVGLLGLKNASQEDTKQAITRVFNEGGVKTILVSADDVSALKRKALDYKMLSGNSDHLVLKGEDFRNLTETERMEKVDRIRVLGNCLPSDKLLLVKCLREKGNIVAMAGWRTNDAPALKEADTGLAMGTWSTEEARENSNIVIRDGSFINLVNMIDRVRCAYGKLQKVIQVQLIMITSSSLINFIGIIFVGDAPMTTIQLFGLSLVMSFIDGMALLTGPLTGKPVSATEPLVTKAMTRNIVAQALYQIIILVTLQQKGHEIIGITQGSIQFMIFNSFILCQFFNLFNARELQGKNFFRGIHRDYWFWVAVAVNGSLHVVFVVFEHRLDSSSSLSWKLWAACFLIGILSWLVDWVGKCALQFIKIDCFTGVFVWVQHIPYPISTIHSFIRVEYADCVHFK